MQECQLCMYRKNNPPRVGQHARISAAKNRSQQKSGVGQHAGMMG
jgi:hypothetical protein